MYRTGREIEGWMENMEERSRKLLARGVRKLQAAGANAGLRQMADKCESLSPCCTMRLTYGSEIGKKQKPSVSFETVYSLLSIVISGFGVVRRGSGAYRLMLTDLGQI